MSKKSCNCNKFCRKLAKRVSELNQFVGIGFFPITLKNGLTFDGELREVNLADCTITVAVNPFTNMTFKCREIESANIIDVVHPTP